MNQGVRVLETYMLMANHVHLWIFKDSDPLIAWKLADLTFLVSSTKLW